MRAYDATAHAQRELELVGEDPLRAQYLVGAVTSLEIYGSLGGSRKVGADRLIRLLRGEPLSELTADPAEWELVERDTVPLWVSRRDRRACSPDGGRSYWMADDVDGGGVLRPAAVPPWWVSELRRREGWSAAVAEGAVRSYLWRGPLSDEDRVVLDGADAAGQVRYMLSRWGRAGAAVAALLVWPGTAGPVVSWGKSSVAV